MDGRAIASEGKPHRARRRPQMVSCTSGRCPAPGMKTMVGLVVVAVGGGGGGALIVREWGWG